MRQIEIEGKPPAPSAERTGADTAAFLTLMTATAARACVNPAARARLLVAFQASRDATRILEQTEAAHHV
jgi:hypothetical protein